MLPPSTRDLWHASSASGTPPLIPDVASQQFGLLTPWWWADHIYPALDLIGQGKSKHLVAREVARGHGKTFASHILAIYAAEYVIPNLPNIRDANKDILVIGRDVAHSRDLLEDLHKAISRYAPWLKHDDWDTDENWESTFNRGMKGGRVWNRSQLSLTNGVTIRAFSITQSVRRFHCYLAIIDDLITEENVNDSAHYIEVIESAVLNAIEPGGVVFLEGTPQADGDALDIVAQDPRWDYISIPGFDETGSLNYAARNRRAIEEGLASPLDFKTPADWHCLWAWRMDSVGHDFQRGQTRDSNLRYEREILLRRITMSDALVSQEDIAAAKDPSLFYFPTPTAYPNTPPYPFFAGGADPSALAKSDAAIIIGTRDAQGRLTPVHLRTMKARGATKPADAELQVVEMFNEVSVAFSNPLIKVEDNQFQGIIKPLIEKSNPHAQFSRITLGAYKHTEAGWLAIRTLFRNRLIALPYGPTPMESKQIAAGHLHPDDIEAKRLTDQLIDQLRSIRVVNGKLETPRSRKDDLVSALFLLYKALEGFGNSPLLSHAPLSGTNLDRPRNLPPDSAEHGTQRGRGALSRIAQADKLVTRRRAW